MVVDVALKIDTFFLFVILFGSGTPISKKGLAAAVRQGTFGEIGVGTNIFNGHQFLVRLFLEGI